MPKVCFYFQVHQPYRMAPYRIFDIGSSHQYFDDERNRAICRKVAAKCYLPANALMLELINRYGKDFKISYSISGVALEQFEEYAPEVIESFQKLVDTGKVELLGETYYHSLAALFNPQEFRDQVKAHKKIIRRLFGVTPKVFRNTELIYSDQIAEQAEALGFRGMLAEGADHILGWRSPNYLYEPGYKNSQLKLLLKNYKLSDDIAFRFSNRDWPGWPLTADKFAHWVHALDGAADTVNLFMDYETIGEHQWAETGIFDFLRALPEAIWKHPRFRFATPSELIRKLPVRGTLHAPTPFSWADMERDLSAWLGNPMQDAAVAWVYTLADKVRASKNPELLHAWRKLQTSDHFYYMCTKYWNDGDVHKYFSIYDRPHDAYVGMNNILSDLEMRLEDSTAETVAIPENHFLSAA